MKLNNPSQEPFMSDCDNTTFRCSIQYFPFPSNLTEQTRKFVPPKSTAKNVPCNYQNYRLNCQEFKLACSCPVGKLDTKVGIIAMPFPLLFNP